MLKDKVLVYVPNWRANITIHKGTTNWGDYDMEL